MDECQPLVDGVSVGSTAFTTAAFPPPTLAAVLVGAEAVSDDVIGGAPAAVRALDGYVFAATLHSAVLSAPDVVGRCRLTLSNPC